MSLAAGKFGSGSFALLAGMVVLIAPLVALMVSWRGAPIDTPALESHAFTTLRLAAGAAVGAGLLGIPLAIAVGSLPQRTRLIALALLCLPLAIPGYVHALAWSSWLGFAPAGIAGLRTADANASREMACLWVWTANFAPLVMLTTYAALAAWSAAWSEAAAATGMSPRRQLYLRVLHARPMVASGLLLVAVLVYADFPVADFFSVGTYATAVFVQLSAYGDVAGALRASLPAIVVIAVAAVVLAMNWGRAERTRQSAASAKEPTSTKASPINRRVAEAVVALGVLVLVVVPIASLATMIQRPSDLVVASRIVLQDLGTTFGLAGLTACFVAILGIAGGHALARGTTRGSYALRGAILATLAIPTAVLGLGAIVFWNRPGPIGVVYVTGAALMLALVARFWPVGVELASRSWAQLPQAWEEAAYVSGRPPQAMLTRIAFAHLWRSWAGIGLVVFVLTLNELTLLTLLAPPGLSTISLRIFSTVHYGPASLLAALCVSQVILVVGLCSLAWLLVRRGIMGRAPC